jgi:hypothetical protein
MDKSRIVKNIKEKNRAEGKKKVSSTSDEEEETLIDEKGGILFKGFIVITATGFLTRRNLSKISFLKILSSCPV